MKSNQKYIDYVKQHTEFWLKFWNNYPGFKRDRILDFGCGTGLSISIAKSLGYNIVGLDVDQRITNSDPIFSEFHKQYGVEKDVIFYEGANGLPFESNSFDAIICCSSLLQDNTLSSKVVNLILANSNRIKDRIIELIRISKTNAKWFVSPSKDWKPIVRQIFQKHNTKSLVRRAVEGHS